MKNVLHVAIVLLLLVFASLATLIGLANRGASILPAPSTPDPLAYDAGMDALSAGDHDTALELLRRVPEDHPDYARALRHIGWKIYASRLGDAKSGVAYVNRSLLLNPFDGNVWEDAFRIYVKSALPFLDG